MSSVFLDEDGQPLEVRGYAVPWNEISGRTAGPEGRRFCMKPGAADWLLERMKKNPVNRPLFDLQHDHRMTFAATHNAGVELWADDYGLAFRLSNLQTSARVLPYLTLIGDGSMSGASMEFAVADEERLEGVHYVSRIRHLQRVAICAEGAFAGAAAWLSGTDPYGRHRRGDLATLMRAWSEGRPA